MSALLNHRKPSSSAFTLVELLAVIVIMSLTVTMVSIGLHSAEDGAALLRAAADVRAMDARARLHARTSGKAAIVRIDEESGAVMLVLSDNDSMAKVTVRDTIRIILHAGDSRHITFDRLGRSADYMVRIESPGGERSWRVAGLTGIFTEQGDAR